MMLVALPGIFLLLIAGGNANPVQLASENSDLIFQADQLANCPAGYTQPTNSNLTLCYKIYTDFKSSKDAATQCKANNGTLTSVPNAFINSYLTYLASQNDATSVWLGIQCFNGDKTTCMNNDGTGFGYNSFKPGQPGASESCIYLSSVGRDSQQWSTFDCAQQFPFACEAPVGPNVVKVPTCPTNYTEYQGMCYKFVNLGATINYVSANTASADCRKIPGGNLATSSTEQVNNFLLSLKNKVRTDDIWISFGLRCPNIANNGDTSSCAWVDGTPFSYNNFIYGNPSVQGSGPCCDFWTGQWSSCVPCDSLKFAGYFCQAPGL